MGVAELVVYRTIVGQVAVGAVQSAVAAETAAVMLVAVHAVDGH